MKDLTNFLCCLAIVLLIYDTIHSGYQEWKETNKIRDRALKLRRERLARERKECEHDNV